MDIDLSIEEIFEYRSLGAKFAQGSLQSYMQTDLDDDSRIDRLPKILAEAREIGLLADRDNGYGIWGYDLNRYPYASLWLLSILSEVCAAASMCFHQNGLALNILHTLAPENNFNVQTLSLSIQEENFLPQADILKTKKRRKPAFKTRLSKQNGRWILNGAKHFVYSPPDNEAYLVFAQDEEKIAAVMVPVSAEGVKRETLPQRLGLLACTVEHVNFNDVQIESKALFSGDKAYEALLRALFIHWLGVSALALGTGKGALKAAKSYAKERYQGGTIIENHAAVQRLITSAEVDLFAAEAQLNQRWRLDTIRTQDLRRAAMMKLSVTKLCTHAVSNAMQCYGGYGYMEDYGIEKRFRDVNTLKSMAGTPLYLKRIIFELGREE